MSEIETRKQYLNKRDFSNVPTKVSSTKKASSTIKKTSTKASTSRTSSIREITTPTLIVPSTSVYIVTKVVKVTATPTVEPTTQKQETNSVSAGAIVGIVASVLILLGGLMAFLWVRRKKNKRKMINHPRLAKSADQYNFNDYTAQPPPMQQPSYTPQPYQPTYTPQEINPYQPAIVNFETDSSQDLGTVAMAALKTVPGPSQTRESVVQNYSYLTAGTLETNVYWVIATYTPTLSDELDIQVGDKIELLMEYDDGWCQGINLSRGRVKGVFPKHCINVDSESVISKRVSSMYII